MKIIPNRTMRLGGKHVERAKPIEVPDADGEHAVRHGWAAEAKKGAKVAAPADAEPASDQSAPAE